MGPIREGPTISRSNIGFRLFSRNRRNDLVASAFEFSTNKSSLEVAPEQYGEQGPGPTRRRGEFT